MRSPNERWRRHAPRCRYEAVEETVRELGASIQAKTLVHVTNTLARDMRLASGCTTSGAEHLPQIRSRRSRRVAECEADRAYRLFQHPARIRRRTRQEYWTEAGSLLSHAPPGHNE